MTWPLLCAEGSLRASCRPTPPIRPSTTLSNPQGASLCDPAASSNSSYVPCYQLLCESRLSTPARHIRSYPFWVRALYQLWAIGVESVATDAQRCWGPHLAPGGLQAVCQVAQERRTGTVCQRVSLPQYRAVCTAQKPLPHVEDCV